MLLGGLGKFCELDEDCDEISHAKCSKDHYCICRKDNVRINAWTCAPTLGSFCWQDELCATENALCINKECRCTANYFSNHNNQCIPKILGTSCETDEICNSQVKFSKCSEDNICTCIFNTIEINPRYCAPTSGGVCWQTDECVPKNLECINNICQCEQGTAYDPTELKCRSAYSYRPKLTATSSKSKSICSDFNNCMCYQESSESFFICTPMDKYHCETNDSCLVENSLCIEDFCQCKPRFLHKSQKCIPAYLNELCSDDSNCNQIRHAVCSKDKVCVCDESHIEYNKEFCKSVINGFCSSDADCLAVNSTCIERTCQCKPNMVKYTKDLCITPDANLTLITGQLGIPCEDHLDCADILGSQCSSNKKCECLLLYEEYNTTACAPLLGRSCSELKLCAVTHSSCADDICICDHGFVKHSIDKCVPHYIGMECEKNDDCRLLLDSKCINYVCACRDNYTPLNATVCAPQLGEYCRMDQQCAAANSICIKNKCKCQLQYESIDRNHCLRTMFSSVAGLDKFSCDHDGDCNDIKYSHCSLDKVCSCKPNYYYYYVPLGRTKCVGLIGEICDSDDECISYNSVCVNHICQCLEGLYAPTKYQCDKISLGSNCQANEDCSTSIINSECSSGKVCVCHKNYIASSKFECWPTLFEKCSINKDCQFNNSACFENKCQCLLGFRAVSESQCKPIDYMYPCDTVLDCGDPWHYQCDRLDKRCRCNVNHFSINKSTCMVLLKGYCWSDSQCLVNNAACIDFHCQCKENFVAVSVSNSTMLTVNHERV
ncbi:Protein of unknown function [Cotesia congregata]|uniref:EGF-like domain-containing protein n=1 Tax=Cotesia congregata TaxID=51543 RepID=A0A8J2H7Q9_COTCN|nr:Protein of unknown function [Cotesia congregata]